MPATRGTRKPSGRGAGCGSPSRLLGDYVVRRRGSAAVNGQQPQRVLGRRHRENRVAGQETKRFPVEFVSWDDAVSGSCGHRQWGDIISLPSRRSGSMRPRGEHGSVRFQRGPRRDSREYEEKAFSDYGVNGNSAGCRRVVGGKRPNAWDCMICKGTCGSGVRTGSTRLTTWARRWSGPTGPPGGSGRVSRGGHWPLNAASALPVGRRLSLGPGTHGPVGFRVSRVLADK